MRPPNRERFTLHLELLIRQKKYPAIRKKLWGEALSSPSYFAGSCGGAPISVIRQYIELQRTPS